MKTGKKILFTALSAMCLTTLVSGVAVTAFADSATEGHEFSDRNDVVFENFNGADMAGAGVTASASGASLGNKSFLRVDLSETSAQDPTLGAIYKSAPKNFGDLGINGVEKFTFRLRAPEEDVELSELALAIRRGDNSDATLKKITFEEVNENQTNQLPDITAEWQDYTIELTNSDFYTGDNDLSTVGFHFYATADAEGIIEVDKITYGSDKLLNDFTNGENITETANTAQEVWWADTAGSIVKREVKLSAKDGQVTVLKKVAVGSFAYAIIEAEGDTRHLKVETTADGTAWKVAAEAYDGFSVNLEGTEKGFRFTYTGEGDGVTLKRIYLTNNVVPEPSFAAPVIDASTADVLEDFAVAQTTIPSTYESAILSPELGDAGLFYRLSYQNADKVAVTGGSLVFDATELGDGYINFKFNSKSTATGKYLVFKVKGEDGANMDNFEIGLISENDGEGAKHSCSAVTTDKGLWYSGYNFRTLGLTEANPYQADGWTYVIVDIDESRLTACETGYSGLDMYYRGSGKLYIDAIFFCNGINVDVPNIEKDITCDEELNFTDTGTDTYAGGFGFFNDGYGTTVSFDITPKAETFNVANLRLQFVKKVGGNDVFMTRWGRQDDKDGMLITTDGKTLDQLTFAKDQPTHVVVDLAASEITEFYWLHSHYGEEADRGTGEGAFTLTNVKLHSSTPVYAAQDIDTTKFDEAKTKLVKDEIKIVPDEEKESGYQYTWLGAGDNKSHDVITFTVIPESDNFVGWNLRFKVRNDSKTNVCYLHDLEGVVTDDGKKFSEIQFEKGVAVNFVIDISKLDGYDLEIAHVDFETDGMNTGSLTVKDFKLLSFAAKDFITPAVEEYYAPKYTEQLALLPVYLDTEAPTLTLNVPETATAGDEVEIKYTVSDNLTAAADITVTVTVTKDGEAVTLTNNKFTAEEGTYSVTVTARDANGNETPKTVQITVTAPEKGGLSTGAIVGIVVGCIAAVAVIGGVVFFVLKKKKNN